jgi:Family of unknown function (DUF6174)
MRRLLSLSLAAAAVTAPALAIAGTRGQERRALAHNRAVWKEQHLRDYRFRLRIRCFCPASVRGPITVTVRNGRPHGATDFQKQIDTVPEMFAQIERAVGDKRAGDVDVKYSSRRGFPRKGSIDRIKKAIDDEFGWTVDHFRALRSR